MPTTEQVKLQEITIGNSDFKDVIDSGTLFVDKTVKLADLAKKKKAPCLWIRRSNLLI